MILKFMLLTIVASALALSASFVFIVPGNDYMSWVNSVWTRLLLGAVFVLSATALFGLIFGKGNQE